MITFTPDEAAEIEAYDRACEAEPLSYAEIKASDERDKTIKNVRPEKKKPLHGMDCHKKRLKKPDDNALVTSGGVTMTYRERQELYYAKRREKYAANQDGTRDRALAYQKAYKEADPQRAKEQQHRNYLARREEHIAYMREYNKTYKRKETRTI